ncbi:MAG: type II toxin-antitoxin system ParD family antitoxin [Gammaproteobacteria bacterium]|nr:type II toxin-antitoxin system ParD family antitoxin [Gammaproteobacteria bacterium]
MNVSLTPQLEDFVKQKVSTGMYSSVSEVIREALRLLEEKEALKAINLQALREDIQKGIDSLDNGRSKPLDIESIKARGRKMMAQRDKD